MIRVSREAERHPENKPKVNLAGIEELVTDKGYHSGAAVVRVKSYGVRSYIPEKKPKGKRHWQGKGEQQQAVYANRRRVRGPHGKSLLRKRGELIERSFAHCYDTGGLRRCHLRGHQNILKRQLIHVSGFNLSLILRKLLGAGKPREWNNRAKRLIRPLLHLFLHLWHGITRSLLQRLVTPSSNARRFQSGPSPHISSRRQNLTISSTGC